MASDADINVSGWGRAMCYIECVCVCGGGGGTESHSILLSDSNSPNTVSSLCPVPFTS